MTVPRRVPTACCVPCLPPAMTADYVTSHDIAIGQYASGLSALLGLADAPLPLQQYARTAPHALTPRSHPGRGLPNHTGQHNYGMERGHVHCAPTPLPNRMSQPTSSAAGNAEPPMLATSARSRRTLLTCPLRAQAGPHSARALAVLPPRTSVSRATPAPTHSSRPPQLPLPRRT